MTLQACINRFYRNVAMARNTTIDKVRVLISRGEVVQYLNDGMRTAAEKSKGLRGMYKHTLTADQELYELSSMDNDVVKVDRVQVYKSGNVQADMIPESPEILEELDGTTDSSTPTRCSFKLQKHDSSAAIYELRLWPPANWTEASALVILASVRPTALTADTTHLDCPDALGDAGVWQACYQATFDPRFEALYHKALQRFYAAGHSTSVRYFNPPEAAAGGRDPRSYAATA